MKREYSFLTPFALALLFFLAFPAQGAQAKEVRLKESTARISGYKQSVTIRAEPKEITGLMESPEYGSLYRMSSVESPFTTGGLQGESPGVGDSFPIFLDLAGVRIPVTCILVKIDPDRSMWAVLDNDYAFNVQRWESRPVKDGTVTSINLYIEIPRKGVLGGLAGIMESLRFFRMLFGQTDLVLARVQAHFDPSLEPEELVSVGLRGEPYQELLNVCQARVKVRAGRREVESWLADPENDWDRVPEMECECLRTVPPDKGVNYCVCQAAKGVVKKFETFTVKRAGTRKSVIRTYLLSQDCLGYYEVVTSQAIGGTDLILKYVTEIPKTVTPEKMDLMLYLSGLPAALRDSASHIKRSVEADYPKK